jgi:putative SOS response-associated peptidase YedK
LGVLEAKFIDNPAMCNRYRPASVTYTRDVFGFTSIKEPEPYATTGIGPLQRGPFVHAGGPVSCPTNSCTLVRVHAVMIGGWPKGVETGRLAPLWTAGEGAAGAEPFGLVRIGPHAALRSQVNTQSIDLRPRLCLRPDTDQREHRYLWDRTLAVGQWGLIPWFSQSRRPTGKGGQPISTNNCRIETVATAPAFKSSWARGQRCLIPAVDYDEPYWGTGKNVWWRFARRDGMAWALGGLWSHWTDPESGEVVASYTMLTQNCDQHPLLGLMHKPDPALPPDRQDKRAVIPIEPTDWERWLNGTVADAMALVRLPPADLLCMVRPSPTSKSICRGREEGGGRAPPRRGNPYSGVS